MSKDKCDCFRDQIAEYLFEGLDEAERNSMEQHIAQCQECRRELEACRQALAMVDRARLSVAPEDISDAVVSGVRQEMGKLVPRRAFRSRFRAISACAAGLLLGLVGVFMSQSQNANRELEMQVAAVAADAESVLRLVADIQEENETFLSLVAGHSESVTVGGAGMEDGKAERTKGQASP